MDKYIIMMPGLVQRQLNQQFVFLAVGGDTVRNL